MKMIVLAVFFLPISVWSATAALDPVKGRVEFTAIGRPAAIKIAGKGPGPSGRIELGKDGTLSGELELDLDALETGISMRDRHMKEKYLQTAQFKAAKLVIEGVKIEPATIAAGGAVKIPGKLTLHGVERAVTLAMSLARQGGVLESRSEFQILLSDFGLEVPRFSGITVANEVDIRVETKLDAGGLL